MGIAQMRADSLLADLDYLVSKLPICTRNSARVYAGEEEKAEIFYSNLSKYSVEYFVSR